MPQVATYRGPIVFYSLEFMSSVKNGKGGSLGLKTSRHRVAQVLVTIIEVSHLCIEVHVLIGTSEWTSCSSETKGHRLVQCLSLCHLRYTSTRVVFNMLG